MSFLHSRNVLHGDLTGGNVLLTAAPRDPRTFQAKVGAAPRGVAWYGCLGEVWVSGMVWVSGRVIFYAMPAHRLWRTAAGKSRGCGSAATWCPPQPPGGGR